ncbi:MAG: bifunctional phosphoribosyl-AMP cyclohydrolase/phosphoribosyl-ATP diphosphatase HisIE [Firmicutes bacterium]|nr:bifunctional phosphoribosyl-AMP cyclohydrolase/phosphoribosyl-ATP diphosphatase HisIE [Bacillota bacterium]
MFDISSIKFDEKGLIPAVAVDACSGRVLMQAYMNREALEKTLATKRAHYYSRSRKSLWRKGETSGHTQEVVSIVSDCDNDCILLRVIQTGAACHTGETSCFFNNRTDFNQIPDAGVLIDTLSAIRERKATPQEGSYTNYLFNKGREKICKKLGEECTEAVIAAMKGNTAELCEESADVLYHLLVLLEECGTDITAVFKVLDERRNKERKRDY